MTYIPHGPLWCWVLQGEDRLFFSQPTHAILCDPPVLSAEGELLAVGTLETRWLDTRAARVARCQHETQFVIEDAPVAGIPVLADSQGRRLTPPVQCGQVASLDPLGRFFCEYHMHCHWECYHCEAPLPHGEGGFCSQACREAGG